MTVVTSKGFFASQAIRRQALYRLRMEHHGALNEHATELTQTALKGKGNSAPSCSSQASVTALADNDEQGTREQLVH